MFILLDVEDEKGKGYLSLTPARRLPLRADEDAEAQGLTEYDTGDFQTAP